MSLDGVSTKQVRLQKYIADCGICSRRKAEELILQGLVEVNGRRVTELGTKVSQGEDVVIVEGKIIDLMAIDHVYLVLNKPRCTMTTVNDPEGRKTVMDCIKHVKGRVFPVGRLDYLSEGLLVFTNDGDLAHKIMHPKFEMVKTYEVKVFGRVNEQILEKLRNGVQDKGEFLRPQSVRVVEQLPQKTWIEFRLVEGKNREIRRLCEACGLTIDKLKRVAIGALTIDGIAPGEWEYITKSDLLNLLGFNRDGSKKLNTIAYVSAKKSVNIKKYSKAQKDAKLADDVAHTRYRKDTYHQTLEMQKQAKIKREEDEKQKQSEGVVFKKSFQKKNFSRK